MSVVLLVMTDGRATCIAETIPHAERALRGRITRKIIHDDSGVTGYQAWLSETFPDFELVTTPVRAGFGAAIRHAWGHIALTSAYRDERFIWHLEDDFVIDRPVDLAAMGRVLDANPHLAQLALRRQPWNDEERAAGGIVESHPDDYTDRYVTVNRVPVEPSDPCTACGHTTREHYEFGGRCLRCGCTLRRPLIHEGVQWLEHRRFFTTNPSLYPISLCWRGWPDVEHSEGVFTHQLLADWPATRFGFWGARNSGEWCTHVGHERMGVGY